MVTSVLTSILVLVGGFMTFLIMLQEGKGGGLASLGGTKAAGIEGVTNPIRRATGYLAGLFFILAIVLAIINRPTKTSDFITEKDEAEATATTAPAMNVKVGPATAPTVSVAPAAPSAPAMKVETKPAEAPKAAEPVKTEAPKAAEPVKTEAPKAAEPVKTEAPKAAEPAKTEAPKVPEAKK